MPFTVCPFCGIATETLHDTQSACIDALRAEISRAQTLLTRSQPHQGPGVQGAGFKVQGSPGSAGSDHEPKNLNVEPEL